MIVLIIYTNTNWTIYNNHLPKLPSNRMTSKLKKNKNVATKVSWCDVYVQLFPINLPN